MPFGRRTQLVRFAVMSLFLGAVWALAQPPISDPNLEQVQQLGRPVVSAPASEVPDSPAFRETPTGPTVPTGVTSTPALGVGAIRDPIPPTIQLSVRTPSHVPTGKPVPYTLTVVNTSTAKALRASLRMVWPDGAASLRKCEPKARGVLDIPAAGLAPMKDITWDLGNLLSAEKKEFKVEFDLKPEAKDIRATAYVNFEYGATVETKVDQPKIVVKKAITPQVAEGELVTVKVDVTNDGLSTIPNVRLTENNGAGAEYKGDSGSDTTDNAGQRVWKLGDLGAKQTKSVTYQILHKTGGDKKSVSNVVSDLNLQGSNQAEATTKVLTPALRLSLVGPPAVQAKTAGSYTATVQNAGTLALENVKLVLDLPEGLYVSKFTNNARRNRDQVQWMIPRLPAGESQEFRINLEAEPGVSGKKTITAKTRDGRSMVEAITRETSSDFLGKADITWKPTFDSPRIAFNRMGTLKVTVKNEGSETERGVKLRVDLPEELKADLGDKNPEQVQLNGRTVVFPPLELKPGKKHEFVLNYIGAKPGEGEVAVKLECDSLGNKPLTKNQLIQVSR